MLLKKVRFGCLLCAACLVAAFFAGCSGIPGAAPAPTAPASVAASMKTATEPTPVPTPEPTPKPALQVLSVQAVADPPVLPEAPEDPYTEINPHLNEAMHVDRDQYNTVYRAVAAMEPKLDISSFKLSRIQANNLVGSLETNFRLFYLKSSKVSRNGKTVTFTYTGDKKKVLHDRETYMARLSHLIHNDAPEGYSDLQKFLSVYEAICEMSNYTATPTDPNTISPYSIVMKGEGICWGYAMLTEFILKKIGIPVYYVCNNPHAWDVVQLGGKWYHTDATWGAGNVGATFNNLDTVLMDDATRAQTMKDAGYESPGITIEGYPRANPASPPACTDTSFSFYRQIGFCYAFDIDHNALYWVNDEGIARKELNGANSETVAKGVFPFQMAYFNGMIYYINMNDCFLYRVAPGGQPELLDGDAPVSELKLSGTVLHYAVYNGEKKSEKTIPLLELPAGELDAKNVSILPEMTVPRGRSFRFSVQFSSPVDTSQNWNEKILLIDAAGNVIPLHFSLSDDGKTMTVRPKDCVADAGTVSLFIRSGVASGQGAALLQPCRLDVAIQSES